MKSRYFVLFFLFLAIGCAGHEAKHNPAKSNDKFLKEDLDVALWQERFENRDRDVYKNKAKIVKALNLKPGQSVVDVGAGTGFFLKPIFDEITLNGMLYAVDISPRFVSFLKARGEKEEISNLTVFRGSDVSTNLPDESVDIVFVCDTYHHFGKRDKMLEDFKRILRTGGELVVVDFDLSKKNNSFVSKHLNESKMSYIKEISKYFTYDRESNIGLTDNFMIHFKKR